MIENNFHIWAIPKTVTERDQAIRDWFPNLSQQSPDLATSFRGGRQQALTKLAEVNAEAYAKTRNFLNGDVTYLSPYLRHGCITVKEATNAVRNRFGLRSEKLLFEFAWREYWRTVWYAHGMAILHDMQVPKVALSFNYLPADVQTANTGLPCMDDFIQSLADVGYIHNHARMWLASYLVHWRDTDWRLAADWMHNQLLDGDYASNHLSWQWVASTFSSKPYFFNRDNLAKYSHHQYCDACTARCPFQDSYSNLEQKLFKPTQQDVCQFKPLRAEAKTSTLGHQTIVWVHDEMLNSEHSLMQLPHDKVFIFDLDYYQDWSVIRLQFIADCLAEMPNVTVWVGNTNQVLSHLKINTIITQNTPNLSLKELVSAYPVMWHAEDKVCDTSLSPADIKSFSRFWKIASAQFIGAPEN